MDAAIETAKKRIRGMTDSEQNEFWLQYNFIFKERSSLESMMDFVGDSTFNREIQCYTCHSCYSEYLVQEEEKFDVVCVDCGIVQNYPPDFLNGKISDGYQYTNKKCYTRMDHLKSILIELQCGRSREIESIGQHVQEYLYLNRKLVTFTNVRGCLRKLGYHQHYLHIPSILNYLKPQEFKAWTPSNGSIPRILGLFNQYQEHFEAYVYKCKIKRRNSLNYHFILLKLFDLIDDQDVPTRFLFGPKGKKSLQEHHEIWNVIAPKFIHFDYMKF